MCLYSYTTRPKNCFKVVFPEKDRWTAPFRSQAFNYGYLIDEHPRNINFYTYPYEINGGYFHSTSSLENAEKILYHVRPSELEIVQSPEIVHCIIPTGAKYYIGSDGDYASDRLIVGRPIKQITYQEIQKNKIN